MPMNFRSGMTFSATIIQRKGPVKDINTATGKKQRYDLQLDNGNTVEYCPFINDSRPLPSPGETITFRVVHTNSYGTEVELYSAQAAVASSDSQPSKPNTGMLYFALSSAIEIAKIQGKPKEISDVFGIADSVVDWLSRNDQQFNF